MTGSFGFTNDGDAEVTITSIKTSCGCTTAALEKRTYAPGESGTIDVSFAVGDRTGQQVKKVVVRTDDPQTPVTTLTLRVDIPKLIELTPKLLMWRADDERGPKSVDVIFHEHRPLVITAAQTDHESINLQVEELEPGHHYRITATPAPGSDEAVRSVVTLTTEAWRSEAELAEAELIDQQATETETITGTTAADGNTLAAYSEDPEAVVAEAKRDQAEPLRFLIRVAARSVESADAKQVAAGGQ